MHLEGNAEVSEELLDRGQQAGRQGGVREDNVGHVLANGVRLKRQLVLEGEGGRQ